MADRYTKKDVERCAKSLASEMGHEFGNCYRKVGDGYKWQVGCWQVDNNPTYGGSVIQEIAGDSGGVRTPFGAMRRKPREFCETVQFAEKAVRLSKGERDI